MMDGSGFGVEEIRMNWMPWQCGVASVLSSRVLVWGICFSDCVRVLVTRYIVTR